MARERQAAASAPGWLSQADAGRHIDVRPVLAEGGDPLVEVLALAATIPVDGCMVIDAPFNPSPLRNVLAGQGFSSYGRKVAAAHWRISLCRDGLGQSGDEGEAESCAGHDGTPTWREGDEIHVDVRGLTPPQPMLAILRLVARLGRDATVIVHHDREPIYLLPELAEVGWQLEQIAGEAGEKRFRLRRAGD